MGYVGFAPGDEYEEGLRVDGDTLEPAQRTRNEAEVLRVDERECDRADGSPDDSREEVGANLLPKACSVTEDEVTGEDNRTKCEPDSSDGENQIQKRQ